MAATDRLMPRCILASPAWLGTFRRMRASTIFFRFGLATCLLTACGGSIDEGGAPAPSLDEHHPRFVGVWHFEERVIRGGYSMAIWELGANGERTMKEQDGFSGDPGALGGVPRESDRTRCRSGSSWSSVGADRLRFSMTCTDGVDRVVTYRFPASTSRNAIDPDPAVEDVSGERTGWTAQDSWGFVMRKCTSLTACR